MPTSDHEEKVSRLFKSLSVAEKKALRDINGILAAEQRRINNKILRNYDRIKNSNLLPGEKAAILKRAVGNTNPANKDFSKILDELYGIVDEKTLETADSMVRLSQGKNAGRISSRDQIIDFWKKDSNQRIRKWGKEYERKAQALFELAYSSNWGAQKLNQELQKLLAQTQRNNARIIRTSSISVSNAVAQKDYESNNVEYVLWLTAEDDRVCPYCSARNMNIYRIGEVYVPAHVNCRCLLLPVRKEWFLNGKFDTQWAKKTRQKGLDALKKAGGAPNYGLTPFEKSRGNSKPPNPIWTADKGFSRGESPQRITRNSLKYLSLPELKKLAEQRGLSKDDVKKLGKTSLGKKDTWIRAIIIDSRRR